MEILGFAITGLLALIFTIVGVLLFTKINLFGLGPMIRSIGLGKYGKILGIVLVVFSIGGAIAYVSSMNVGGIFKSASLTQDELASTSAITGLSCVFNSAPSSLSGTYTTDTAISGAYFDDDPNDLSHYNAYVLHNNGTRSLNGSITCTREGDVEQAGRMTCFVKADSFRSETSTTDSNTYYILATSASASKVTGFPWAQTAYLNDGSVATTASDREKTEVVFTGGSTAEAQEDLGYYVTLPGATAWSYLNNLTSNDVSFYCNWGAGDQKVARITVTKVSA